MVINCPCGGTRFKAQTLLNDPEILICNLERFRVSALASSDNLTIRRAQRVVKVRVLLNEKVTVGSSTYQLSSIIVHSGTAESGHYYTVYQDRNTDLWIRADDSHAHPVDESILDFLSGKSNSTTSAFVLLPIPK